MTTPDSFFHRLFGFRGRLNRLQLFQAHLTWSLSTLPFVIYFSDPGRFPPPWLYLAILALLMAGYLYLFPLWVMKRCRDAGIDGRWALLMYLPPLILPMAIAAYLPGSKP